MSLLHYFIMVSVCCNVYSMDRSFADIGLRAAFWRNTLYSCMKKTGIALETAGKWCWRPACYASATGGILWGMGHKADVWSSKAYYCDSPPGQPDETIFLMTDVGKYMFFMSSAGVPLCLGLKSLGKRLRKYAESNEEEEEFDERNDEERMMCTADRLKATGAVAVCLGRALWMMGAAASVFTGGMLIIDGSFIGKNTAIPGSCPGLSNSNSNIGDRIDREYKALFYTLISTCGGKILSNMGEKLINVSRTFSSTHYISQGAGLSQSGVFNEEH